PRDRDQRRRPAPPHPRRRLPHPHRPRRRTRARRHSRRCPVRPRHARTRPPGGLVRRPHRGGALMNKVVAALSDANVVARRNVIKITRVPEVLVFVLLSPIMFVLLFGY